MIFKESSASRPLYFLLLDGTTSTHRLRTLLRSLIIPLSLALVWSISIGALFVP